MAQNQRARNKRPLVVQSLRLALAITHPLRLCCLSFQGGDDIFANENGRGNPTAIQTPQSARSSTTADREAAVLEEDRIGSSSRVPPVLYCGGRHTLHALDVNAIEMRLGRGSSRSIVAN